MLNLVKLQDDKIIHIVNKIYDFKSPKNIYIPITTSHLKEVDYVYKNDNLDGYISSVSGNIKGIKDVFINNKKVKAYEIENDFKENTNIKISKKKIKNKEELINYLNNFKLENIIKKITELDNINNLVISSIDEEKYTVKEFLRLSNNYTEVLDTIDYLMNILHLNKSILATKSTNSEGIKNVKSIIGTYPNIKISLVPDKYLISYKDFLCEYLNINKNDTLLLTTNEIYDIYISILKGKYKIDNLITISGDAIEKSLVINTRLYVSLKEVLGEYFKFETKDFNVYINGFIGGKKVNNYKDLIITEDIDSIILNKKEIKEVTECINCGACEKICPVHINVKKCFFNKYSHKRCLGCGLCEYICPAKLNLKEFVVNNNEK